MSFVGIIVEVDGDLEPIKQEENFVVLTPDNKDSNEINENEDGYDTNSLVVGKNRKMWWI